MFTSLMLSMGMCALLMVLYSITGYAASNKGMTKATAFECGFEGFMKMRRPFSIRYFVLVILFLIFDVETVLLFPCLMNMIKSLDLSLLINMMLFLMILMIGLLYEWKNNMLDWSK